MSENKYNFRRPYYAVIFTSKRTSVENKSYREMANLMLDIASKQKGFLGIESARDEICITVSYWQNLEAIKAWKNHAKHLIAQINGKLKWYEYYKVRIAKVEHEYEFHNS